MALSHIISKLYEAYRRRKEDDLESWLSVWQEAFDLAFFILDDLELTKRVAFEAVERLDEEYPKLLRRFSKSDSYRRVRKKAGLRPKLRRPMLSGHQYLDLLVYYFSQKQEIEKYNRGDATYDDLDVWFIKCVIENSYWLNDRLQEATALRMMIGVSSAIHIYDVDEEVPILWDKLVALVPRPKELWGSGDEPFHAYWLRLLKSIRERFGPLIQKSGSGNFKRRAAAKQPLDLVKECLHRFELRESQGHCLTAGIRPGSENLAEMMRVHTILHLECYTTLVSLAGLPSPDKKIGMPEFNIKMQNGNGYQRNPPSLSEREINQVRDMLRQQLFRRKCVTTSTLVITVDGNRLFEPSREINSRGRATINLNEDARLVELWAPSSGDEEDTLLASYLISSFTAKRRKVILDDGRIILFNFNHVTGEAENCSYCIEIKRQEGFSSALAHGLFPDFPPFMLFHVCPRLTSALLALITVAILFIASWPITGPMIARLFSSSNSDIQISPIINQEPLLSNDNLNYPPPALPEKNVPRIPHKDIARPGSRAMSSPPLSGRGRDIVRRSQSPQETTITSLAQVQDVYVAPFDLFKTQKTNNRIREVQMLALNETDSFRVTKNKSSAQALMIFDTDYRSGGNQFVRPRLITKSGRVLWEGPLIPVSKDQAPTVAKELMRAIKEDLVNAKRQDQALSP